MSADINVIMCLCACVRMYVGWVRFGNCKRYVYYSLYIAKRILPY